MTGAENLRGRDAESRAHAAGDARAVARDLAADFARSAVERDRKGGTPKRERDLIRASGLLGLSVPRDLGGAGASWAEVLEVVREFARVDGSLAHVFGFHHLMLATVRLFGTPQQWRPLLRETVQREWFWGNALNPLDPRTRLARDAEGFSIDGQKSFCSGSGDSDQLIVSAIRPPEERLAVAAIPTSRAGITVHADWDNMGQRQTDSGSVSFERVRIHSHELLETPGSLGSVFASLRPCIAQLILGNIYLGIAEGALGEAQRYTRSSRRAWINSGVATPTEDPYILQRYGELWLQVETARFFTDAAGSALSSAWQEEDALTPRGRGEVALRVASAKVATTRAGLSVTNGMFDVMGARATAASADLDRYWRNLRTHTLHDPVDYKVRELGEFALNDKVPTPSFYS
jgi:alkylation response protein AidB-like acyl-CoA dehydrogenase